MKRWTPAAALAVAAAIVIATATPAAAKGADQATITGPGLATPIVLGVEGEPGSGSGLGLLSEGSGLFAAMFGSGAGGDLTDQQPTTALGPKYEIAYRVPGARPQPDIVKQELYPFADGGPVTFTRAGQASIGGSTRGGWYRAPASLSGALATMGIPAQGTPSASASPAVAAVPQSHVDDRSSSTPAYVVLAVLLLAAAGAVVFFVRRRPVG
ncbi:MAG: hypothetical protein HOV79_29005 [Hamadaea sp.]|nr:hypothetical protein [Hamadaea sp.]